MSKLGELSNVQINHYLRSSPGYGGCISKDQLSRQNASLKRSYIVNMQNSTAGPGTHWVLLINTLPNEMIYFDSFGVTPPQQVINFAKRARKELLYNKLDIQSFNSEACGWFCIYVLLNFLHGRNINSIIAGDFSCNHDEGKNDAVLRTYFMQ